MKEKIEKIKQFYEKYVLARAITYMLFFTILALIFSALNTKIENKKNQNIEVKANITGKSNNEEEYYG